MPLPASPTTDIHTLSPDAEAFRKSLGGERPADPSDFSEWWRAQRKKRLLAWALTLALLSPGALCFILQTPWPVTVGVELGGILANMWLRRERRRQLKEIATWEAPAR